MKETQLKKIKFKPIDEKNKISDRDNYVENRTKMLEEYQSCLEEAKKEKTNVPGIINGTDFRQFSIACVFRNIREQEEYTENKIKADYIDIKEEKIILRQMIKDAKAIFKTDYELLYNFFTAGQEDS